MELLATHANDVLSAVHLATASAESHPDRKVREELGAARKLAEDTLADYGDSAVQRAAMAALFKTPFGT